MQVKAALSDEVKKQLREKVFELMGRPADGSAPAQGEGGDAEKKEDAAADSGGDSLGLDIGGGGNSLDNELADLDGDGLGKESGGLDLGDATLDLGGLSQFKGLQESLDEEGAPTASPTPEADDDFADMPVMEGAEPVSAPAAETTAPETTTPEAPAPAPSPEPMPAPNTEVTPPAPAPTQEPAPISEPEPPKSTGSEPEPAAIVKTAPNPGHNTAVPELAPRKSSFHFSRGRRGSVDMLAAKGFQVHRKDKDTMGNSKTKSPDLRPRRGKRYESTWESDPDNRKD